MEEKNKKSTYHHGNLRKELIHAGLQIINEEGIDHLSLRKAAAMCGVSHGAPASHFKNKDEFVEAIRNQVTEEFASVMQRVVDDNQDRNQLIFEFGVAYIRFFKENSEYLVFVLKQKDIEIRVSEREVYDSNYAPFQIFKEHASEVMLEQGLPKEEIPGAILALWGMVYGLSALTVMEGFHFEGDWMKMTESMLARKKSIARTLV